MGGGKKLKGGFGGGWWEVIWVGQCGMRVTRLCNRTGERVGGRKATKRTVGVLTGGDMGGTGGVGGGGRLCQPTKVSITIGDVLVLGL